MTIIQPLAARVREELLPFVTQPGQYIGREINQLVRDGDWTRADVRVAVAFPDSYTIGMSHLGCQILYWLINHTDGCCAERQPVIPSTSLRGSTKAVAWPPSRC